MNIFSWAHIRIGDNTTQTNIGMFGDNGWIAVKAWNSQLLLWVMSLKSVIDTCMYWIVCLLFLTGAYFYHWNSLTAGSSFVVTELSFARIPSRQYCLNMNRLHCYNWSPELVKCRQWEQYSVETQHVLPQILDRECTPIGNYIYRNY